LPSKDAIVPNAVKVKAIPAENTSDNLKDLFGSLLPAPPTYPITSGTLDKEQGVIDVKTPANSATKGASHALSDII
jgi:hypothetical protein